MKVSPEVKKALNVQQVVNLTQHAASVEQIEEGIFDVSEKNRAKLLALLDFQMDHVPSESDIKTRAWAIAQIAREELGVKNSRNSVFDAAMIGGAPFLMPALQQALRNNFPVGYDKEKEAGTPPLVITSYYAYSKRVSVEELVDGETIKTSRFRHLGLVGRCYPD